MSYWARHLLLLILLVLVPLVAAIWGDCTRESERAAHASQQRARRAAQALSSEVMLGVLEHVDDARALAHELETQRPKVDWLSERGRARARRRRKGVDEEIELLEFVHQRLAESCPRGGFAWLVDAEGAVLVGGGPPPADGPRSVSAHPLFVQSQEGFAGDAIWSQTDPIMWAAAAPLVIENEARGAVVIGWPIDQTFVHHLSQHLEVGLTLVSSQRVLLTSVDTSSAALRQIVEPALRMSGPVLGGSFPERLPTAIPGFPLMVGPLAEGLAYASMAVEIPGVPLHWVLSVSNHSILQALAPRQIRLMAVAFVLSLVLLLFAVINHRTYLSPIDVIAEHLSNLQFGRREAELPERKVSSPFRRLVRLVNMVGQKIPSRTTPLSTAAGLVSEGIGSLAPVKAAEVSSPKGFEPSGPESQASPSFSSLPSYDSNLAEMPPVLGEFPAALSSPEAEPTTDGGELAAIIAKLAPDDMEEAPQIFQPPGATAVKSSSGALRSADDVRGATPDRNDWDSVPSSDPGWEPSPSSSERNSGVSRPALAPSGIRAGGSLDLNQGAGLEEQASYRMMVESTIVSKPDYVVLTDDQEHNQEMTVVASVDPNLLSKTVSPIEDELADDRFDDEDMVHYREVYENFLHLRERCGERTKDIPFERFLDKLENNRAKLVEKYNCRTVRFQVYEKDGKAALKATPVRT
ncbi:MAG: hypothetical protein KTR25_14765 [Myxococcales bacterium]|nr:hypothetical protein [Myxococcales bacterium]